MRDFVFEYRGQLGPNIDRVLQRTYGVNAEDFDIRFRRYLRQRFLKMLTESGEPIDFGDQVRLSQEGSAGGLVRARSPPETSAPRSRRSARTRTSSSSRPATASSTGT